MLAMLTGTIASVESGLAIIEVAGVGYEVRMPSSDLASMRTNAQTTVYTYLNVAQDSIALYGFLSQSSKTLFVQLQKVSGIGPRVALSLLSTLTASTLVEAVSKGDVTALSKAPGLGKKGAQKIILELSGKINVEELNTLKKDVALDGANFQVVQGLISLGWSQKEAEAAVEHVCAEESIPKPLSDSEVPVVLRKALTVLDKGR